MSEIEKALHRELGDVEDNLYRANLQQKRGGGMDLDDYIEALKRKKTRIVNELANLFGVARSGE